MIIIRERNKKYKWNQIKATQIKLLNMKNLQYMIQINSKVDPNLNKNL